MNERKDHCDELIGYQNQELKRPLLMEHFFESKSSLNNNQDFWATIKVEFNFKEMEKG